MKFQQTALVRDGYKYSSDQLKLVHRCWQLTPKATWRMDIITNNMNISLSMKRSIAPETHAALAVLILLLRGVLWPL